MERLTARDDKTNRPYYPYCFRDDTCDGKGASEKCDNCNFNKKTINKLAEYEDAEEQGLLLRLPCKVGDILWHFEGRMREPMPCAVKEFIVRKYRFDRVEIYFEDCEGFSVCDFNGNLDEGWYLTFEEAEQALAEMKNIEETKDKLAEEVESIGYLSKEEAKRMIEQALTGKKEV